MNRKRKNSSLSREDDDSKRQAFEDNAPTDGITPTYSSVAERMMAKMGHKMGKGLGKNETGRVNIVEASNQRGRRGLGLRIEGLEAKPDLKWEKEEEILIRQDPEWLESCSQPIPSLEELNDWIVIGQRKEEISDEYDYCEPEILDNILKSKNMFDKLGKKEFLSARFRANPYETIRGAIFQNRAAAKMAEIDASFDFMFSKHADRKPNELLYFADICAGPGGFSEYIFWRTKWKGKGFGMTIKAEWANDFKLVDYIAGTPETFDCYYGAGGYQGDGDIFKEENLVAFRKYVMENSEQKGLHFVMADGGFSVEGQENIQEILSKQLYLCQFLCALSVLRPGGHFICKLFDLFTSFSIGLVYLMYMAFDEIAIFKPVTSRPANSERYLICKSRRENIDSIHDYMFNINNRINNLKGSIQDISELVPAEMIKQNHSFYEYIFQTNNSIGARQILGLKKLVTYIQNTSLAGADQGEVRKQCLVEWEVPTTARFNPPKNDPDVQFKKIMKDSTTWMGYGGEIVMADTLKKIKSIHDYKFSFCGGERVFLFSLGRNIIYKWTPVKNDIPEWRRADKLTLELPRFTLIDAELVFELTGEGKGQRKKIGVHIIDAVYLGEDYIGDLPLSERLQQCEMFVKALDKPCRNDLMSVHLKTHYSLSDAAKVFDGLSVRQMKQRMEERICADISDDKYLAVTGLYLVPRVREPWHLHFSKSKKRLYFFNSKSNASSFEPVKESIAGVTYCTRNRLMWKWSDNDTNGQLSKSGLLEFITDAH